MGSERKVTIAQVGEGHARERAAALSSEALGAGTAEDFLCSVSTWTVAGLQPQKGKLLVSRIITGRSQAKGKEAPCVSMVGFDQKMQAELQNEVNQLSSSFHGPDES
ncbi:hypothetical protein P7K49_037350 [Saguinus oedipus]|uniref:Uncharacterized protein n=1 Tax=Saguinus oedipus TaxID=9490 RepID=A0ABQ9THT4_SAGOE|nr:hypothetical protein P7K49_037350 [Saguinus oedipus]